MDFLQRVAAPRMQLMHFKNDSTFSLQRLYYIYIGVAGRINDFEGRNRVEIGQK